MIEGLAFKCDSCGFTIFPDPFVYRKSVTCVGEGLRMTAKLDKGWVYLNGLDLCSDCQTPTVVI